MKIYVKKCKIIKIKFGYIILIRYLCIQKGEGKTSTIKQKSYKPLNYKVMRKTNNTNAIEEIKAVENVRNAFPMGETIYMGCLVKITYIAEAHKYETKTGKMATKSTRYFGTVTTPEGETINLIKNNGDGWRGGEIGRYCGLYVRYEREDADKQGELWEITNRRK